MVVLKNIMLQVSKLQSNQQNGSGGKKIRFLTYLGMAACYAIGGQNAPRVISNLIKLRVGRCLTVPLYRRLYKIKIFNNLILTDTIYNIYNAIQTTIQ